MAVLIRVVIHGIRWVTYVQPNTILAGADNAIDRTVVEEIHTIDWPVLRRLS
ncbi:MAG TPA: hypothetical protein VI756_06170 [Blastocatellia bacterium]